MVAIFPGPDAARVTSAGLGDGRSAIISPELIAGSRRTGSPQDHTPENLSYREIHLNCVRNGNIRTASVEVSTATGFWPTPPRFLAWKKKSLHSTFGRDMSTSATRSKALVAVVLAWKRSRKIIPTRKYET